MDSKNKVLHLNDVLSVSTTGKKLTPTSNSTVQPVALMRLGLFVPTLKRKGANVESVTIDASKELAELELAQAEGYSDIRISGPRLSMETDFKVWVAIIVSFSRYGEATNSIELPFTQFASFAGYPDKEKTTVLRTRISESLTRLRGTTISLSSKNKSKHTVTGLLQRGQYDIEADTIKLQADESLWELYRIDNQVLLQMIVLRRLANKGSAQALYTFIESLPQKPLPLSFTRIKKRLLLTSADAQQNRTIKKAIEDLQLTGYLDGSVIKKGKEWYLNIHSRNSRCKGIEDIDFLTDFTQ
ncbi:MAG: RepB family plasmid replication initiator protein [Pantoea sp.]|uniref:RepB family plasmid replication initiator protein n=1 Tax=Pantoea TaxID=53335 RepID=UPI001F445621|nr:MULTISPECIES: RepB family plasmid replication initiator protein [Pantoea]MBS6035836.1 RepB family plasmid replication initiator protein [Pantoea sp.]MDU7841058.1 protein RepA [Pantoea sp.]UIL55043.1 protein RepA [Pantoea agglomerans]